ncbi:MAG: DUF4013 domain-containing protein [Verrucomicrobiota bacterium]
MNYQASISDFFKSPQWGMNMLLGSVAALIPAVGPIVVSGWVISVLWTQRPESGDPARFPAFDFQFFAKYLERGLWPFLVNLVASLALMPVMLLLMFGVMSGVGVFAPHAPRAAMGALGVALIGGGVILYVVALLVFYLFTLPLTLRATLTQGFAQAFSLHFVKGFLSLIWLEALVVWMFLFGLGIVMMIIAICTCYIGLFPSLVIVTFALNHLLKQLYQLYVDRGGEPITLSANLMETPPALPPVAG